MKSGTISRRDLRERRPARPPVDYLPILGALALGLMIVVWFYGHFTLNGESAVAAGTPSPQPTLTARPASPTPRPTATFHPIPLPTPTPTPSPTPSPTPTPSPSPTASPSPTPTPTPSPIPTLPPGPTPPPTGLVILSPPDGAVVNVGGIVVSGVAAPGSTITWDRPLWFDDHTIADANGQWSFVIGLNPGDNVMTFRVADDLSTARTITVTYQP